MKSKYVALFGIGAVVLICCWSRFSGKDSVPETDGMAAEPYSAISEIDEYESLSVEATEPETDKAEEPETLPDGEGPALPVGENYVPADTVKYVESTRVKETEKREVKAIVNEADPSTYEIVRTEQEVEQTEELPAEYTDVSGNVRYRCEDGVWYEHRYSSGDIALDSEDEATARMLLELFGDYDGYEVMKVECEKLPEGANPYVYHVLYRKIAELSGEPEDVDGLTVTATRAETVVSTVAVEEKVAVTQLEEVETGDWLYYGWQELDGETFYFDENAEKVTGEQVIEGLRYRFDEDGALLERSGVDVSSRTGAIDWQKVRDAGIRFAVIRCGYRGTGSGTLAQDRLYEKNVKGARAAGLEVFLYFYTQG